MSLLRQPLLVLDVETSGLPRHPWARPIEIAVVALDLAGAEVGHFSSLIRADNLPPDADDALRVNHLTRAEVAAAPGEAEVHKALGEWSSGLGVHVWPVTSFNTGFDRPMIARHWPDTWGLPGLWAPCVMLAAHRIMDSDVTYQGHRWDSGELKWPRLSEAAAYFNVEVCEPQHRALGDARTAAEIVRAIAQRRREHGQRMLPGGEA